LLFFVGKGETMKRLSMVSLALLLVIAVGCGGKKQAAAGGAEEAKKEEKKPPAAKVETATLRLVAEIDPETKNMLLKKGEFQVTSDGKAVDPAALATKAADPATLQISFKDPKAKDKAAKELKLIAKDKMLKEEKATDALELDGLDVASSVQIEKDSNCAADYMYDGLIGLPRAVYVLKEKPADVATLEMLADPIEVDRAAPAGELPGCFAYEAKESDWEKDAQISSVAPVCLVVAEVNGQDVPVATASVTDGKITTVDLSKSVLEAGKPYAAWMVCTQVDAELLKGKTKKPVTVEFTIRTKIKGGIKVKAAPAAV
jgi:hypothetical protein